MNVEITWNEGTETLNLPAEESEFFRNVSEKLATLPIPNTATVSCPYGNAVYDIIKKSGTAFIREDSNTIVLPGRTTYPEVYLTCINPQFNNYKYYRLTPKGDEVIATYGRIGAEKGDMYGERTYNYPKRMFWVKYQEKLAKGYVDQSKVYLNTGKKGNKNAGTNTAVVTQDNIPANVLYRLLRSFAKQYVEAACVTSHVTQGMVDASRKYLDILYKRKTVKGFNNSLLKLLTVCPRKVDNVRHLLAEKVADFSQIIDREETLLAAMEGLVNDEMIQQSNSLIEGFHGIEVYIATDTQKKQVLEHLNPQLHNKVKNIYRVIPQDQQKRFNAYLKANKIHKVMQLWHGSRNENWLSIVENGLKLRPNAIITGKMFGHGIYFAPSSMKSWNYTSFKGTTWANGNSNTGFMALYATAYGEPLDVYAAQTFSQNTLGGKNCVHAHAGAALRNDEIVYYSEDAMVINYLVEFSE